MVDYVYERHLSGGVRLPAHKDRSTLTPIRRGFLPRTLVLALHQHRGTPAEPIVAVGQRVFKGQQVAAPGVPPSAAVHAATSGHVRAIEQRVVVSGAGVEPSLCIVIDCDGLDEAREEPAPRWPASPAAQIERIRQAGLAGLGGAVFPTADKLAAMQPCKTLIVNGAECEPYISCDDMLMRESASEIVWGTLLMADLLQAPRAVIAIERDKQRAIEAVTAAARAAEDRRLKLAELPTIYPAGGERQLVELLAGEEVPSGRYPTDIGYICQNVGTAYALARLARAGEPLTTRIVTVTGAGVAVPQNVEVPIGTPIGELIELCGGYTSNVERLVCGGSMMGYSLPSDELPIGKSSNCIIAATADEIRSDLDEWACIRCGDCASACSPRLLPQELLVAARSDDFAALAALGLDDCIECGCCDVICPSHIGLTETFRAAKRALAIHRERERFAAESDARFQRREDRLRTAHAREHERLEALKHVASEPDARQRAIQEALRRVQERRGAKQSSD